MAQSNACDESVVGSEALHKKDKMLTSSYSNYMLGSSNSSSSFKSQDFSTNKDVEEENMSNTNKQKLMEKFLVSANNEYTPEQMKTFLKEGIMASGLRMMKVEDCDWYYDYYQGTKLSVPPVKELNNASVNYYYYTTPFQTQFGNMNLVMMHSQVNFDNNTYTPADRSSSLNAPTPQMIERAKIQAEKYKQYLP